MPALVRLAIRNLGVHKGKTLIVGVIVALGVMILVVGSSVLGSASRALKKSFIDSFTTEIVVTGKARGIVSLFGVAEMGAVEGTPLVPDFQKVTAYLRGDAEVRSFTPQISGAEQLNRAGEDTAGGGPFVYLFGIDPSTYGSMFRNARIVSGAFLEPGQEGILLSTRQVEDFGRELGDTLKVGDKVLIQSFGNAIREVTLRGIFTLQERNMATDLIAYIDPQSLRALLGMASSLEAAPALDAAEAALLTANEDTLFRGKMVRVSRGAEHLPAMPGTGGHPERAHADGAWQFILVNLTSPGNAASFIARTNQWFAAQGIEARASDWRAAAGVFAMIPDLMGVVFTLAVIVIAIVAMIIIMNTLVVSISERTGEIGTMRALGAQKGFVWRMLLTETLAITVLFGALGAAVGSAIVGVLSLRGIPASSIGSSTLRPSVDPSSLGSSLFLVIIIAVLAAIYPVRTALGVQPVTAMQARAE